MSNLWNLSPGFSPAPVCPSNRACPGDRAMIRWRRGGRLLTGWFASLFMAIPLSGNAQPIRVEAVSGVPFGVGSIILPRGVEGGGDPWADGRMDIRDAAGRLLYPVYGDGPVRQLIRDYAGIRGRVRLYFLFRGGDPLNVQLHIPQEVRLHVVPRAVPADVYRRQLLGWWRAYTRAAELRTRVSDYPPMVDAYLTSMLAGRLRLPPPSLGAPGLFQWRWSWDEGAETLLGSESLALRTQVSGLLRAGQFGGQADRPLPDVPPWPARDYPAAAADLQVEPIALHVPEDCFYLRCGTYANYVWMQALIDEWGGELRNMISERGVDYQVDAGIERALGLKDNALARALGGTIISDVAIIGADPFFREGAAMGILFEARNNLLLQKSLDKQRGDALAREEDAAEESVEIAGQAVSYMSDTTGGLRSYYAIRGNYHLVTTSRALARDFLLLGKDQGKQPLGRSAGFRHARTEVPVDRGDTLFLYLSEPFFQRLASPPYRIEMLRRMRSLTEMQSLQLARLAADLEGVPARSIPQLVAADLLPAGFGQRADGSEIVEQDGHMADLLRGMAGRFVPIPDMEVRGVSTGEADQYQRFVRQMQTLPSPMDPLICALRRSESGQQAVERLEIMVRVAPLGAAQYQRLSAYLGPARPDRLALVPGDLLRIDGVGPQGRYLFLGVQDFEPALTVRNGRIRWALESYDQIRAYLGGVPDLGQAESLLAMIFGAGGVPDIAGYVRWPFGLWQRSTDGMTLLAFRKELLDWVTPQLVGQPLATPAQLHLHLVDLSQTRLAAGVNALGYQHARQVSSGNCALMKQLQRQLGVAADQCRETAERLVGARLLCPLGGEYRSLPLEDGRHLWVSSAWSEQNAAALVEVPTGYQFPVLQWLRGLQLDAQLQPDHLTIRADLLVARKPVGGIAWPELPVPPQPRPPRQRPSEPEELPPPLELDAQ
ncbi:MAG: hypothetical protein GTO03_11070 [Planctomycetales bacterium]|nr:hypothetical protein [Planctomycetales bacterium]